jgi:hypothetical protein
MGRKSADFLPFALGMYGQQDLIFGVLSIKEIV